MYTTEAEFNMNDVIFEQGWQSDAVYLLQKGDVELYAGGVNELQTGPCIIGEYSTLHDTNRKVSVKAKSSKAIVYLISKQDLFFSPYRISRHRTHSQG
jgi:CRP-like cAMP-binding protein